MFIEKKINFKSYLFPSARMMLDYLKAKLCWTIFSKTNN